MVEVLGRVPCGEASGAVAVEGHCVGLDGVALETDEVLGLVHRVRSVHNGDEALLDGIAAIPERWGAM